MPDGRELSYEEIQRAEGPWKPGMFYDVGGAAAMYWPDQHPERREPAAMRWLVFDPWGGVETVVGRLPRPDFIGAEIGMVPFLRPATGLQLPQVEAGPVRLIAELGEPGPGDPWPECRHGRPSNDCCECTGLHPTAQQSAPPTRR
jgi:hypothetical protein